MSARKPRAETSAPVSAAKPVRRAKSATSAAGAAPATEAPMPATSLPRTPLIQIGISVRWRDLDAFHHVNNSNFLTYIEEARLQWLRSLPEPWLTQDTAPLLAASHVNYRRPIEWPEEVVVELFAERVGTTSLTLAHRLSAARDADVLYSDGHSVMVWIDRRSGKPAPLPEGVRNACANQN